MKFRGMLYTAQVKGFEWHDIKIFCFLKFLIYLSYFTDYGIIVKRSLAFY